MAQLEVFVNGHLFGCPEARRLAGVVAERLRSLSVRVVDLDIEPTARPESVIAVPTYVLDDRVVALGNPRQEDLLRWVEERLPSKSGEPNG